jgi:hypothetical protein
MASVPPLVRSVVGNGDETPEVKALVTAWRPRAMASVPPLVRSVVGDGDEASEAKALVAAPKSRAMTPLVRFVVGDGNKALEVKALGDEELVLKALVGKGDSERQIVPLRRFDRRPRHIFCGIPGG